MYLQKLTKLLQPQDFCRKQSYWKQIQTKIPIKMNCIDKHVNTFTLHWQHFGLNYYHFYDTVDIISQNDTTKT